MRHILIIISILFSVQIFSQVSTTTNVDPHVPAPYDARQKLATLADTSNLAEDQIWNGMIASVQDEERMYIYWDGWKRLVSANLATESWVEGAIGDSIITLDQLDTMFVYNNQFLGQNQTGQWYLRIKKSPTDSFDIGPIDMEPTSELQTLGYDAANGWLQLLSGTNPQVTSILDLNTIPLQAFADTVQSAKTFVLNNSITFRDSSTSVDVLKLSGGTSTTLNGTLNHTGNYFMSGNQDYPLQVIYTGNALAEFTNSGFLGSHIKFSNFSDRWEVGMTDDEAFYIEDSDLGTPSITIPDGGDQIQILEDLYAAKDVGVGTSAPINAMHIYKNNVDGDGLRIANTNALGAFKNGVIFQNGQTGFGITGWPNAFILEGQADGHTVIGAYADDQGILFQTDQRQNRMFINSSGQVGIGTITPEKELHVYNATGNVEVRAEGLDRSIFRLENNSVGEEGDLYSISFRSDLDDIIHEYYDASTASYYNLFSYNTTDQSMSLNPTTLLLNGSSSITGDPILAAANVGWKESYYQSAYARGISSFGIFDKTGGWIYFGNSNSSNNGSSDLIDSGANVGINAAQNNIQFKNRTTDPATPRADYGAFYVKNDEPYFIDDTGTATSLVSGGAAGSVAEEFLLLCDGTAVTVGSGTYTSTNVTATQTSTTSYADVNGSSITYTPPSGAQMVIYEFTFTQRWVDAYGIGHFKLLIDGVEVTQARKTTRVGNVGMDEFVMRWPFYIGGSADTATGRQATWTTGKTIKVQFRSYSSSYDIMLHELYTWDGAVNTSIAKPKLSIKAIR